jgi:hypothetical protein
LAGGPGELVHNGKDGIKVNDEAGNVCVCVRERECVCNIWGSSCTKARTVYVYIYIHTHTHTHIRGACAQWQGRCQGLMTRPVVCLCVCVCVCIILGARAQRQGRYNIYEYK